MNKNRARTQRRLNKKVKTNNVTHIEVYTRGETKSKAGVVYITYRKTIVKKSL